MRYLPLILTFSLNTLFAQNIVHYYDFSWKPTDSSKAVFGSIINETDSGWKRIDYYLSNHQIQMAGLFEDDSTKIKNGFFTYYYEGGELESSKHYIHNKLDGHVLELYIDGTKRSSSEYKSGVLKESIGWHRSGSLSDSIYKIDGDLFKDDSWFGNKQLASTGNLLNGRKQGSWKFFDMTGKLTSIENYDTGAVVTRQYFDAEGKTIADTTNTDKNAEFIGGKKMWQKYLAEALTWPGNWMDHRHDNKYVFVLVDILIDENGYVQNAEIVSRPQRDFDKITLDVIKSSPRWNPTRSHNRITKQWYRQPITIVKP